MKIEFFPLGCTKSTLAVFADRPHAWPMFCQMLASNYFNEDIHEEDAIDIVELVQMDTPDEEQYIEAIRIQGKIVGSCEPLDFPLDRYVEL